jgi:hypothetical protein
VLFAPSSGRRAVLFNSLGLCLSVAPAARAAQFIVDTEQDDPGAKACDDATAENCSLRGAILSANAAPEETHSITVPAGDYVLREQSECSYRIEPQFPPSTTAQVPLCLSGSIVIEGAGVAVVTIDGNDAGRVVYVAFGANVAMRGLSIRHGRADRTFSVNPEGGGIRNHGTLELGHVVVSDNTLDTNATGAGAGGIQTWLGATLSVVDSVISQNITASLGGDTRKCVRTT